MNNRHLIVAAMVFMAIGIGAGASRLKTESIAPSKATASSGFFSQTLPDSAGRTRSLNEWKGKVLIVNFWASWCAPCVKEMPELSALQDSFSGHRIQIIGIGIDSIANIAAFADKHRISYPLYTAENDGIQMSRDFGNQMGVLPFTVLLDPNGTVRKTYTGIKIEEIRKDLAAF